MITSVAFVALAPALNLSAKRSSGGSRRNAKRPRLSGVRLAYDLSGIPLFGDRSVKILASKACLEVNKKRPCRPHARFSIICFHVPRLR